MAANWGRWLKYAQAKLNSAVSSSNAELDDLEAEQRAAADGKPWISSSGEAPTLDETRARIEWEAAEQQKQADAAKAAAADPAPTGTELDEADPDVAAARVELDRQARESQERLDAIRKELGVDPPEAAPPKA